MATIDQLMAAFGAFGQAAKEYGATKGIEDATNAVTELKKNTELTLQQRLAAQSQITNQLQAGLAGLGAPQTQIAAAVGALAPPKIESAADAMRLANTSTDPMERESLLKEANSRAKLEGELNLAIKAPEMKAQASIDKARDKNKAYADWLFSTKAGTAPALPAEAEAYAKEVASDVSKFSPEKTMVAIDNLEQVANKFKAGSFSTGLLGKAKAAVGMETEERQALFQIKQAVLPQLKETFGANPSERELLTFLESRIDFAAPKETEQGLRDMASLARVAVENKSALQSHLAAGGGLRSFIAPLPSDKMRAIMKEMKTSRTSFDDARAKVMGTDGSINVQFTPEFQKERENALIKRMQELKAKRQ